jgi:hypothetical protein
VAPMPRAVRLAPAAVPPDALAEQVGPKPNRGQ